MALHQELYQFLSIIRALLVDQAVNFGEKAARSLDQTSLFA